MHISSWATMTSGIVGCHSIAGQSGTSTWITPSAASNAMAGRPDQAQKAMARLRQLNPTLRISNLKDVLGPYQHAEDSRDTKKDAASRVAGITSQPVVPDSDENRMTSAFGN